MRNIQHFQAYFGYVSMKNDQPLEPIFGMAVSTC